MQFGTIDFQLQKCEQHLDATGARNTEIEYYLVQFLLVRICAEYESRIAVMIERRCSRMRDLHVKRFTQKSAQAVTKRFDIGDIKGILLRFGDDYKQAFHDQVVNKPPHTAWDNIYTNRQAVAHRTGTQMSFADLKTFYKESLVVLDALATVLGLKPRETRDFT